MASHQANGAAGPSVTRPRTPPPAAPIHMEIGQDDHAAMSILAQVSSSGVGGDERTHVTGAGGVEGGCKGRWGHSRGGSTGSKVDKGETRATSASRLGWNLFHTGSRFGGGLVLGGWPRCGLLSCRLGFTCPRDAPGHAFQSSPAQLSPSLPTQVPAPTLHSLPSRLRSQTVFTAARLQPTTSSSLRG